ncbi:2-octaprenyl-6-methoxyphenol hydroxylase [Bradyrhizobium sp. JR7.2]|jgi:2-octaprenyl-6-methoxyphenol hydroxylase|uniref:Ubiquinone biosynthesis hydroxylase n=2 Tax=Bradyrhizobium barranii TaxID=2992140 RepID=A0A7Z0Q9J5_9BRAD|nr:MULTISPECIES: ubiquinone biosynthesis hydroxylase [Bradyrhizobium]MCK1279902.1 ubiquinone biosynthesis hydroxylase [Bradyrhizobium sp. 61]MCK1443460.1 ubiquinone biosynthesis hydroxylase [Bradyrhizobium sp. 48]MCK1456806.1 ubiquinone biosynthesis hydroxylase [Bradyrhizobium sp. 2]TFW62210.1 ubiquinone biosynthesis hydroxylase [Bradyrhizobium sp. MOS001]UFW87277.1 ubiquinone biosynthesis hydroxylase [Bradyrhizobium japonicum]
MPVQGSIVIGGGAFAGLALALALRQGLGPEIPVIVADPALATRPSRDPRATAIVAACRRLFEAIGAWDAVRGEAQPILDMVVTDSKLEDATRPVFLNFAGDVAPGEPFAHMVENRRLIDALVVRAEAEGIDLRATTVASYDARPEGVDVTLGDGSVIAASLLVAADGARSKLRERAGIVTHGWEYDQSGIVVTVGHERDHDGRAEEHFLPAGPFAILPLSGKRSSLVWTERRSEAARIIALSDEEFHGELERRFGLHLGEVKALDKPRAFPLSYFVARSFIAERLALVGDSAHVIHPIAGQGLNMGLKDVAALAEVVVDAARLGMDLGGVDVLERYQRWRRFDTMAMGVATNSLNFLFSNQSTLLRTVRDIGLGLVDRAPPLKNLFIRQAAGLTGEIPRLLKGEAL